jgi:enamine deaminase RidA (YjgF/YER057c/UK114 family)
MTVELSSPAGMFQPVPYHHVAVGTGTRHVHIAGQIARDAQANPVAAGDLTGQIVQALRNTSRGLAGAGARFADVVRLRFFVTGWSAETRDATMAAFLAGIEQVTEELGIPRPLPPLSVIGVEYLFEPDVLVEIEAYAVLD